MTTFRTVKNRNYTTLHNACIHDQRLSIAARGTFCIIMSLPDDWVIYQKDLQKRAGVGKHTMSRIVKELETHGYLYRARISEGHGKIKWVKEVYEHPELNPNFAGNMPSTPYNSIPENSTVENVDVERKCNIVSTNLEPSTNLEQSTISTSFQKTENEASGTNGSDHKKEKLTEGKANSIDMILVMDSPRDYTIEQMRPLELDWRQWNSLLENERRNDRPRKGVVSLARSRSVCRHPALEVYNEITEYWPKKARDYAAAQAIMDTVGDEKENVAFWAKVVTAVEDHSQYNSRNTSNILNLYTKGEIPENESTRNDKQGTRQLRGDALTIELNSYPDNCDHNGYTKEDIRFAKAIYRKQFGSGMGMPVLPPISEANGSDAQRAH